VIEEHNSLCLREVPIMRLYNTSSKQLLVILYNEDSIEVDNFHSFLYSSIRDTCVLGD
jgi:hypothetical protein